jgi:hypothetical protein
MILAISIPEPLVVPIVVAALFVYLTVTERKAVYPEGSPLEGQMWGWLVSLRANVVAFLFWGVIVGGILLAFDMFGGTL